MEKLIEKLSSYNILNNLIPGAAFIWLSNLFGIFAISQDSIIEKLFIYYFCGMIVSRIGSIVIEKICLERKIISYVPKKEYVEAAKRDKVIEELLETSNLYRTCAGMILTIGVCKIYVIGAQYFNLLSLLNKWLILILLFVLFFAAFCKQTKHISIRIEATKEVEEE